MTKLVLLFRKNSAGMCLEKIK